MTHAEFWDATPGELADRAQAYWDHWGRFFCGVQSAVWSQEPLRLEDFSGEPQMTMEEKRGLLQAKADALWPKPQP